MFENENGDRITEDELIKLEAEALSAQRGGLRRNSTRGRWSVEVNDRGGVCFVLCPSSHSQEKSR